jgi:hypothetical protein
VAPAEQIRRRHAAELRDFVWHLAAYLVVNALLFAQDWAAGDGINWAYWVAIPWGAGVLFHAVAIVMGRRDEP